MSPGALMYSRCNIITSIGTVPNVPSVQLNYYYYYTLHYGTAGAYSYAGRRAARARAVVGGGGGGGPRWITAQQISLIRHRGDRAGSRLFARRSPVLPAGNKINPRQTPPPTTTTTTVTVRRNARRLPARTRHVPAICLTFYNKCALNVRAIGFRNKTAPTAGTPAPTGQNVRFPIAQRHRRAVTRTTVSKFHLYGITITETIVVIARISFIFHIDIGRMNKLLRLFARNIKFT